MASRSRFSPRHAFALLSFLLPLALLAWLGLAELRRQSAQTQDTLEREAFAMLGAAKDRIEDLVGERTREALEASKDALRGRSLASAALWLRDELGHTDVLDVLLLDDRGSVEPLRIDIGLPGHRMPRGRSGALQPMFEALQQAETHKVKKELGPARDVLHDLVAKLVDLAARRPSPELDEMLARARIELGAIERALGNQAAAQTVYNDLYGQLTLHRAGPRVTSPEMVSWSLLTEVALAELSGTGTARVSALENIALGSYDLLADTLLAEVVDRLLQGITADTPEHVQALAAARLDEARRRGRSFTADFELMLQDTVRRMILVEPRRDSDTESVIEPVVWYQAYFTGDQSSLLAIRPATQEEASDPDRDCGFVVVRFDLLSMLAALQPVLAGEGQPYRVVVQDTGGIPAQPAAVAVPASWNGPMLTTHGLGLVAVPADAAGYAERTSAAARTTLLLFVALVLAAASGAMWLWRSASREAELASLKVDLVSRVSHELKTPLQLVKMYGETLALGRAPSPDHVARYGNIVAREADRLTNMIQNILDFSRQQAGTLVFAPQPHDLGEILRAVCSAYEPHLQSKGFTLQSELPDGIEAEVDGPALESAVVNLLENAVKYTDPGTADRGILLRLSRHGDLARIEVLDHGRGIPEGEREQVFAPFFRASNAGEVRGAGLGLNLVRHFATAHGGTAVALPRPGGGSILQISLPTLTTTA